MDTKSLITAARQEQAEGHENADIHHISDVELKMQKAQPQGMNLEMLDSKFQNMK